MKMLKLAAAAAFVLAASVAVRAATVVETFDAPPSGWTTDRYVPDGFNSPVNFDGDNRLKIDIDASDGANNRPPSYSSPFYNTQGMKRINPAGTNYMSIDLFLDQSWLDDPTNREFGLWGVGRDATDIIVNYPIVEFAYGGFRGWDSSGSGSWNDYGLPPGISGDEWVTLSFMLDALNDEIDYMVNNTLLGSVAALGTTYFGETILQGYNTTDGRTYSAYVDNLITSAVPVPAAAWLLGSGIAFMFGGGVWRKRKNQGAVSAMA